MTPGDGATDDPKIPTEGPAADASANDRRQVLAVACDGGYLRISDPERMAEYERLTDAAKAIRERGYQVDFSFCGLAGLCASPRIRVRGVDSLRRFGRLHADLTGETSLTYLRRGRRVVSSEFRFRDVPVAYDGRHRRAVLANRVAMDFMPGKPPDPA